MSTTPESFLAIYEREQGTTMRVLRAYPSDKLDLRPHAKLKSARELAWVFALDSLLGAAVFNNEFAKIMEGGPTPEPPDSWNDLLAKFEGAHHDFVDLIRSTPANELEDRVQFVTGPGTIGEITRIDWLWFLLHDQIHHRGQFSVYLRMAEGKVPSIYGPTADEPWM